MNDNVRNRYEGGLHYRLDYYDDYWYYCPDGPFTVDGIDYHRAARFGVHVARTMIELLDDIGGSNCGARMVHSQPPNDAELDHWVHTGSYPQQPPIPPEPAPPPRHYRRWMDRRPVRPLPVDF